jgi:hypothetical protein
VEARALIRGSHRTLLIKQPLLTTDPHRLRKKVEKKAWIVKRKKRRVMRFSSPR